jgi:hypothetical protein
MNYQMYLDPYLIEHLNHRHEELLQEMERLREDRAASSSRLVALAKRGVLPLLRAAHLAG